MQKTESTEIEKLFSAFELESLSDRLERMQKTVTVFQSYLEVVVDRGIEEYGVEADYVQNLLAAHNDYAALLSDVQAFSVSNFADVECVEQLLVLLKKLHLSALRFCQLAVEKVSKLKIDFSATIGYLSEINLDIAWLKSFISRRLASSLKGEGKKRVKLMRERKRLGLHKVSIDVHASDVKALLQMGFVRSVHKETDGNEQIGKEDLQDAVNNFYAAALAAVGAKNVHVHSDQQFPPEAPEHAYNNHKMAVHKGKWDAWQERLDQAYLAATKVDS